MRIDNEGKIHLADRENARVMDEFEFDCSAMADEIIELREKVKGLENDLYDANNKD